MRRRLRGSLWLLLCIALVSLSLSRCSRATSLSSKLRDWLGRGGEDHDSGDGGKSDRNWPRRLFSSLSQPRPKSTTPPLRVWIDAFGLAKGEANIMLEEIESSPDLFSLAGNPDSRSFLIPKGYYDPDAWDYLFSAKGTCERARGALSSSPSPASASSSSSSEEEGRSSKAPPPPPPPLSVSPVRGKKKILSCIPGARGALTSKSGLAATLEAAGLFLDPGTPSSSFALLPRSIPLARPGAAWDAAAAVSLGLGGGGGIDQDEWVLKSGGHRGKGVEMIRGVEEAAARAAAAGAGASLSRFSLPRAWFASGFSSSYSLSPSFPVLQAAVSPQATVGGGRRFYLRVLFALVSESGGGLGDSTQKNREERAVPRAYLYRGGIVIAESRLKKKKEKVREKGREKAPSSAPPPSPPDSSSNSSSSPPPASPVPVVNMWLHDPEHVAVWRFRDLAQALDGESQKEKREIAAAARRGIEEALGLAVAAAAPLIAEAGASSRSLPLPSHSSVELLGADFVLTPEGKAALLEINELPSLARLQKGGRKAAKKAATRTAAAEQAFDEEKEAVVGALLRFVSGMSREEGEKKNREEEGQEGEATRGAEVEAARSAGLKPLSGAVAAGQRALDEIEKRRRSEEEAKCPLKRLARRLFLKSAAGDASAALLARVSPRFLVFVADLAARAGVAGPVAFEGSAASIDAGASAVVGRVNRLRGAAKGEL